MIPKINIMILLFTGSTIFATVRAQDYYSIQYSVSIPTNDLRDYIPKASFRGVTIEYFSKITSSFAAGISIGWNGFYERKTYATYQDGTSSLSGIQYRYSDAASVHLNCFYFLRPENDLSPFAGLGIGGVFTNRITDMGLYRWDEDAWSFSLKPEAGILYSFYEYGTIKFSVRYNESFKNSEMRDQSFLSVNLGFVFKQ